MEKPEKTEEITPKGGVSRFISQHIILVILGCILAGLAVTLIGFYLLSAKLIDTHALEKTQLSFDYLNQSRDFYSKHVTDRVKNIPDVSINADYQNISGGIPTPTTFTIELSEMLSSEKSGSLYRLYSGYPFPNRAETGGVRDDFERDALQFLTAQPKQSYARHDNVEGRPVFRYAEAVLMEKSCVSCHNSLANSPKKDWQVGDVRGILSVSHPIDNFLTIAKDSIGIIVFSQILVAMFMLLILATVMSYLRNVNQHLKQEVDSKTSELRRLATTDSLTQLANRGKFDETLVQEWKRMQRQGTPLSLLMCDIDYFKPYNDTYGHQEGDECLRKIARVMKETFQRTGDVPFRYGGEEFIIILPNTYCEQALITANRLMEAVASIKVPHSESKVSDYVTLSIGLACRIPSQTIEATELINMADQALYQAKSNGRNQTCIYKESEFEAELEPEF